MTIIAIYGGQAATYPTNRADYYAVEDIDMQLDDAKYQRLTSSGYLQLDVMEKEVAWLTSYLTTQGTYTPSGQASDLWYQVVGNAGAFNDSAYTWLEGLGYQSENLSDMWWNFWNDPTDLPTGA